MTKPYSKLQKKLEELESLLEKIFSLPLDSPLSHQVFSDEFVQQSEFLKKLLSAEIKSHPPKPHHLHHISQRLEQLQSAYQNWEAFGMSLLDRHIDDASPCSCTESCFNDDDDDDEGFEDDQKMIVEFTGVLDEEKGEVEEFSDCLDGEKVEEKKEEEEQKVRVKIERVGVGRLCGALGGGIILGMALMGSVMVTFYSFFQYEEQYANMLKPT